jgi:Uncharacterized conserved protein (COG2071)
VTVSLEVADVLVVSWEIGEEDAQKLTAGLEACPVDGRYLVSVVGLGRVHSRAGRVPLASFSQLNLRTYVLLGEETAVLFLRSWVTVPGLAAALAGAPVAAARIRSAPGRLDAPGIGVRVRYALGPSVESGPLGRHEHGLFRRGVLRSFTVRRGPADWHVAEAAEVRAEPLLSLGLEPAGAPTLLYAPSARFELHARARRVGKVE